MEKTLPLWSSFRELAAESSHPESSDISRLSQSNGMPTAAKSLENELPRDVSLECKCAKGTSDCKIHPSGMEEYLASMRVSHAQILASPEIRQALEKVRGLDFTRKSLGLPMRYDLNTSSWKMSQQSLLEPAENGSEPSLATLPSAGIVRVGVRSRRQK